MLGVGVVSGGWKKWGGGGDEPAAGVLDEEAARAAESMELGNAEGVDVVVTGSAGSTVAMGCRAGTVSVPLLAA